MEFITGIANLVIKIKKNLNSFKDAQGLLDRLHQEALSLCNIKNETENNFDKILELSKKLSSDSPNNCNDDDETIARRLDDIKPYYFGTLKDILDFLERIDTGKPFNASRNGAQLLTDIRWNITNASSIYSKYSDINQRILQRIRDIEAEIRNSGKPPSRS